MRAVPSARAGHAAEVETRGALSAAGGGVEADGVAVDAGAPVAHGDVEGSLVRAVEHQQEGGPVADEVIGRRHRRDPGTRLRPCPGRS